MRFEIAHETQYAYETPAAEAYLELRLSPPSHPWQEISGRSLSITPPAPVSCYRDFFGNETGFLSIPFRHVSLSVHNRFTATTATRALPANSLEVTVQEARQILASQFSDTFPYLQFTRNVTPSRESTSWARRHFPAPAPLGEALQAVSSAVYREFQYESGSTEVSTPLHTVWRQRRGVCQDFAHVLLSILRTAGLPCRYVCGYIETTPPPGRRGLVGSIATHAWVELLAPGMQWVAIDPTNDQWCGEQHVDMAYGRDFHDASPLRGTFKGSGSQKMSVRVRMKRV